MSSSRKRKAEDDLSPQRARANPSLSREEGHQAEGFEEELDGQCVHPFMGMGESAKEGAGCTEDHDKDEDNEDEDGEDEDDGDENGEDEDGEDEDDGDENGEDEDDEDEDDEDEDGGSSSLAEGYSDESEDEGYGDYETEIEEETLQLKEGRSVKSKTFSLESGEFSQEWMQTIIVSCTLETQTGNEDQESAKEVGHAVGRYINRSYIISTFWTDMDELSEELSNLAFSIFDRYGRLRHEFKEHIIRRGTGVWGSELDTGNLFVIEDMLIDRAWRRHGLGRAMLQTILRKAKSSGRDPSFILVRPGFLTRDIRQDVIGKTRRDEYDIQGQVVDGVTAFYQANGFRRIGASSWLGLAIDESHPALSIPASNDYKPAEAEYESEEEDDRHIFLGLKSRNLEKMQRTRPLHHAALVLPDADCVHFFETFAAEDVDGNEHNRIKWLALDQQKRNILHIAATNLKPKSVQWLLNYKNDNNDLSTARNLQGYTPLEDLQDFLERNRTTCQLGMRKVCVSDSFTGHAIEAVQCLAYLQDLQDPTRDQLNRLMRGCTCDQCIDGIISPRMKLALLYQAEVSYDMLYDDINENGPLWVMAQENLHIHVAPDIRRNFRTNKSLRNGFRNLFDFTAQVLRDNQIPSINNVLTRWRNTSEWPPVIRNFLDRGGEVKNVLQIIFENARDQDEWAGDGSHMDVFQDQIEVLPECRNDHEFGFVALSCGVDKDLEAPQFLFSS